jgi:hypothetical protein
MKIMIRKEGNNAMRIDRDLFRNSKSKAKEFLQSTAGVTLHELGHYIVANENDHVAGHILVEALDCKVTSGKFAFSDEYKKQLDVDRCAFISAAGAMTELYFCDLAAPHRLQPDIIAYRSLLSWVDPRVSDEVLIGIWHNRYAARIGELASSIEMGFEKCIELCATEAFLLNGVHVIPTYLFDPPYPRSQKELDREFEETSPLAARQNARENFMIVP